MPSGTTSLPMPSPGMTAILSLLVAFAAAGVAIGFLLALPVARSLLRCLVYFSNPIRCDRRSLNACLAVPRADAGIGSCEVGSAHPQPIPFQLARSENAQAQHVEREPFSGGGRRS